MQVELKHTLTVDKDAWFIRLYAWVYGERVDGGREIEPTFCSLFWGWLFMPLSLLGLLIFTPILGLANFITSRYTSWRARRKDDREWLIEIDEEGDVLSEELLPKTHPHRDSVRHALVKIIGGVSYGVSRTIMFAQAHKPDQLARYIRIGLLVLAGIVSTGGTIFGLSLLFPLIAHHLALTGIIVGLGLGLALAVITVFYSMAWIVGNGYMDWVPGVLVTGGHGAKKGAKKSVHSIRTFGHVMLLGLVAVKSNTCPKIELVERKADG